MTMTYTDDYGHTYNEENIVRVDWITKESLEEIALEYLKREITEDELKKLTALIDKAESFPSNEDIRGMLWEITRQR